MPHILHLDFETFSSVDLLKVGLSIYAKNKTTDIWCAAFAFDDDEVRVWRPGDILPAEVIQFINSGGSVYAHNAAFERNLCNHVAIRKYGWPELKTDQMVCTMAQAFAMGLPGSLEGCSSALGIDQRKDLEGSRLMKQMSKPRAINKDGSFVWWNEPEKIERLIKYCVQDVIVEREAGNRMLKLSSYENKVWQLDQKINERGIKIDITSALKAMQLIEEEKDALNKEIQKTSDGQIATVTSYAQIKNYLTSRGVSNIESVDKSNALEILSRENLPDDCRRILEIKTEGGKASTAKLDTMVFRADDDHRVRGCFQYSGANTRRWAGRAVQFHNLKRPDLEPDFIDYILKRVKKGISREEFHMCFGSPFSVIADCIRGLIIPESNKEFLACDFNAIEARVLAWLAGQESTLKVFRKNGDIYVEAASKIFGKHSSQISKPERLVGKVAVLALGFGGGVGAFQTMAKGYGIKMQPAFEALWDRASYDQRGLAEMAFEQNDYGSKHEIDRKEYIASDLTKIFWREKNQYIVKFWQALEDAAIKAVLDENFEQFDITTAYGRVASYKKSGSFLWCRLPSGGVICYPYPEIKQVKTPWGMNKMALTYMAEDSQNGKRWNRFSTYGGSLAENITQAVARDLLADAMLRLEDRGFEIVLHVHDEIVCENEIGTKNLNDMSKIMSEIPVWAKGLPVSADGWIGQRFRK